MQHDTTTHNKVVKRYKLFLHNKCCTLLHEKLGSFDRGLINQSLSDGIMPKLLKIAKVIPVHKGQETNISGNYRPISLLSMFEKLIEKVMCNRLKLFLKKKFI